MSDLHHDYTITDEGLTSEVALPNKYSFLFLGLFSIVANFFLAYLGIPILIPEISSDAVLIIAIIFAPSVFISGFIGGMIWGKVGKIMARATYMPFIMTDVKPSLIGRLYLRFAEDDSRVFLEGNSIDITMDNIKARSKFIFRISISQLGFFVTIFAIVIRPLSINLRGLIEPLVEAPDDLSNITDPMIATAVAVTLLGLYYPMSMMIDNSNLRTFNPQSRFISQPGKAFSNRLEALVGIGAITTGWNIFNEVYGDNNFLISNPLDNFIGNLGTLFLILDYIAWLLFVMFLSWPLILPAAIYYYHNLEKDINEFRTEAIMNGIPIGISMIREPTNDESALIGDFINEQVMKKSS